MVFSSQDSQSLQKILRGVAKSDPFSSLLKLAQEISENIADPKFAFAYLGLLLAVRGEIDQAVETFKHCQTNALCRTLSHYLKENKKFEPKGVAFDDPRPYTVCSQTAMFQNYLKTTVQVICSFAKANPPPKADSDSATILDVGTGNGLLITDIVNALVSKFSLKKIHLILLDQSKNMLKQSKNYCGKNIKIKTSFTLINAFVEDLKPEQLELIKQQGPIWFINAALSIHHIPWEKKITVLKTFKKLSPFCFISDVNANHDQPAQNSPELFYSVFQFYGATIDEVFASPATPEDQKACIDQFLLVEVINILKNTRETRIDYHTPIDHWKKLTREAGYNPGKVTVSSTLPNGYPCLFTLEATAI